MTLQTYLSSVSYIEMFMGLRSGIPIILIVIAGAIIGHWDQSKNQRTFDTLTKQLFLPCLVFSSLHRHPFNVKEILQIGTAATVLTVAVTLLSLLVMGAKRKQKETNFLPAIFMSSGTLLLPMAYIFFGNQGLAKAIYFHLFMLLLYHTLGIFLTEGKIAWRQFLKTPSLYAALLGMACAAITIPIPEAFEELAWLGEKGIDLAGLGALPLLLISFGYPLGRIPFSHFFKGLPGGLIRSIAAPTLAFLLIYVYRKSGWLSIEKGYDILGYIDLRTTEAIIVISAAMPSSHRSLSLDASGNPRVSESDAATVLFSTICSIVTVTIVFFFTEAFIFFD